jgi:hypothetical protein
LRHSYTEGEDIFNGNVTTVIHSNARQKKDELSMKNHLMICKVAGLFSFEKEWHSFLT